MASMIELDGKVALITGGSRGIGLACAELLARQGASVFITARDAAGLNSAAAGLRDKTQAAIHALPGDVTDTGSVEQIYQQVRKQAGRLDILVANAGIMEDALVGMVTPDQIQRVLAVNVAGVLNHMQIAARLMKRGGGGSMIVMSSIIAQNGNAGQMLYGASKAALLGAMLSAARELAPFGIRVNALAPGFIDTAMTQKLSPAIRDERIKSIGMGRIGQPEDVARAALFLASGLSCYVTGQVIGVDGGMVV